LAINDFVDNVTSCRFWND